MMYRVLSRRMDWPAGTLVSAGDLGGNISALVAGGKIEPVAAKGKKVQRPGPVPALEDDSADEPEEQ
jgi:hypothetical protein